MWLNDLSLFAHFQFADLCAGMAEDERHPDTDQIVESTGLDVDQVGRFTLGPL